MKIKTLVKSAAAVLIAALLALVSTNYLALQNLKVRGPIYDRIMLSQVLIADLLPPSLNIIEAYLDVSLMMFEPRKRDEAKADLATRRKNFAERQEYWKKQDTSEGVRKALESAALPPAEKFFEIAFRDFIPAVDRRDVAAAKTAYDNLSTLFDQHHSSIEAAIKQANDMTASIEVESREKEHLWTILGAGVSAVMLMLAICGAYGLMHLVLGPFDALRGSMLKLAGGETEFEVSGLGRNDEVGAMSKAVELFRQAGIEQRHLEAEQAAMRAKEQARQNMLEHEVQNFRGELSGIINSLGNQINSMRSVAKTLATVSGTTTEEARGAEESTGGAAANAQAVAAATEELGASIREIAGQAHRASDIVTQTTQAAQRTNADVEALSDAAQKIGSIVEIIKNVAEQTNLLALNATIEAARAGEAGKGFAVVATEVKNLAAQTAKATSEISSQIQSVQTSTGTTVDSIRAIATRIDEINGLTGSIAAAVEQQEAATREIAHNVTSAADRSQAAAANVRSVLKAADQSRNEAETMAHSSEELANLATKINGTFEKFISTVSSDIQERRANARHPYDLPAVILSGSKRYEARCRDMSVAGMRLSPLPELVTGASVMVDFGQGSHQASVVWKSDQGVGLAFAKKLSHLPPKTPASRLAA